MLLDTLSQTSGTTSPFDRYFLSAEPESLAAYQEAIALAQQVLLDDVRNHPQPYSGQDPRALEQAIGDRFSDPFFEQNLQQILINVGEKILSNSVRVAEPTCMAHLHCPPLIPALAAEVLVNATNQSMDSWDQSPSATILEQRLVTWLCKIYGYGAQADGVFTSGGTQSNFMGLLLARDRACRDRLGWSVQQQGLPPEARRFRILCSEVAHFTIRQGASLLGLGEQAVVPVKTDPAFRMCPQDAAAKLAELRRQDLWPIALVATAGTTDFGSIDPLEPLAAIAREAGLWFHVDAAFGGALILSDRQRPKLAGIDAADSLTVDFHKLFYQPISCGAFLVRDRAAFELMRVHADYLNPEGNEAQGIPDLVTKSVQTTRRFDALKLWVSLQAVGRQTFGEMIDTTITTAHQAAQAIDAAPDLELVNWPEINAVVFRYAPPALRQDPAARDRLNQINREVRWALLRQGRAVIAQTQIGDRVYLKFTLLNPRTTLAHLTDLLQEIQRLGTTLEISHG